MYWGFSIHSVSRKLNHTPVFLHNRKPWKKRKHHTKTTFNVWKGVNPRVYRLMERQHPTNFFFCNKKASIDKEGFYHVSSCCRDVWEPRWLRPLLQAPSSHHRAFARRISIKTRRARCHCRAFSHALMTFWSRPIIQGQGWKPQLYRAQPSQKVLNRAKRSIRAGVRISSWPVFWSFGFSWHAIHIAEVVLSLNYMNRICRSSCTIDEEDKVGNT